MKPWYGLTKREKKRVCPLCKEILLGKREAYDLLVLDNTIVKLQQHFHRKHRASLQYSAIQRALKMGTLKQLVIAAATAAAFDDMPAKRTITNARMIATDLPEGYLAVQLSLMDERSGIVCQEVFVLGTKEDQHATHVDTWSTNPRAVAFEGLVIAVLSGMEPNYRRVFLHKGQNQSSNIRSRLQDVCNMLINQEILADLC